MACRNHPDQVIGLVACSRCGGEFCGDCVVKLRGEFLCATCRRTEAGDDRPSAGTATLDLASIGKRSGAAFIDWFATVIPSLIIFMAVVMPSFERRLDGPLPDRVLGLPLLFSLIASAVWFAYDGAMLCWRGQTLGKMVLGIRVVTPDGRGPTAGQLWLRAAARGAFHAAFYYIFWGLPLGVLAAMVNYAPAWMSSERKAVHDAVARTRVVNWSR